MVEPESPKSELESSKPASDLAAQQDEVDPVKIIPLEAAKAHLRHWWREPLAGFIAVGAGLYDVWFKGKDEGLTMSLDEILILGGVVLIAGSRRLFSPAPMGKPEPEPPEKR
jgi:hypothetical protein